MLQNQDCRQCEQTQAECICKAVAAFFEKSAGVPGAPVAPTPRPIAIRSLQRLAAGFLVALTMGILTQGCGQPPEATVPRDTLFAQPSCMAIQGQNGVEFYCPNGGFAFTRYRNGVSGIQTPQVEFQGYCGGTK